jgi:uncharacterized damage-inducible protein DinB
MIERKLSVPEGYDAVANPRMASFAAQLEDQLTRLRTDVEGLDVRQLEWQPQKGVNTVGMLLAHLAVVDLWWLHLAPRQTPEADGDRIFKEVIGIGGDGDGLPLAADGEHPATLAGKPFANYWKMIERARAVAHTDLRHWKDAELNNTYPLGDRVISREWTVYHVLEHFCGHYGQILLLKHMMRDAGVLPKAEKS